MNFRKGQAKGTDLPKNMVSKGLGNESIHEYDMGLCPVNSLTNFLSCAVPEYFPRRGPPPD